ncbi:hypothetical protein Ocin01_00109 [Orchesella cincta]|uniref:Uncharacterized protein n=1 Tax=Orchesella cincta TaxID=48709 RepID=A0A1D2NMP3_ORCCI|nr:hypothetical protein Ocin01_00109 [Orchesella cincta]
MLPSPQVQNTARAAANTAPSRPIFRCLFCAAGIFRVKEENLADAKKRGTLLRNLCTYFELEDSTTRIPSVCYQNAIPLCGNCTRALKRFYEVLGPERELNRALRCVKRCFNDGNRYCTLYPAVKSTIEAHRYAYLRTLLNTKFCRVNVIPISQNDQRLSRGLQQPSSTASGLMPREQSQDPDLPADYLVLDPPIEDLSYRVNASPSPEPPTENVMTASIASGAALVSPSLAHSARVSANQGPVEATATVRKSDRIAARGCLRRRN